MRSDLDKRARMAARHDQLVRDAALRDPNRGWLYLCWTRVRAPYTLRDAAARNPFTSAATLTVLALGHDERVRVAVAGNPNTPPEALELLSTDGFPDEDPDGSVDVRVAAAGNPNTASERLAELGVMSTDLVDGFGAVMG